MTLPRSLALRTALASAAAVFLVSMLGFGSLLLDERWNATRQMLVNIDANLQGELSSYLERHLSAEVLAVEVRDRKTLFKNMRLAIRDTAGRTLIGEGNLVATVGDGCTSLPDETVKSGESRACGQTLVMLDGARLTLVAIQGLPEIGAPVRRIVWLVTVGLLSAGAAAVVGLGFSRWLGRRLLGVTAVAQAVMAGDLARRMPVQGTGDEFDRLVGTLNAVLARIEALVGGVRQVTNDIAHDLRSPLARLRQTLDLAIARPRAAEADAATLETAAAELDNVLATFAALLRIARAEAGLRSAPAEPVDLSALVASIGETYEAVAEEAGQQLRYTVTHNLTVSGDAPLLRQTVVNLVENALTHAGPGAMVRIDLSATAAGIELSVADNGPGIPAEERGRVLERFYRLDRSRTTPGSGLGLALVAAIAGLHEAKLTLDDAAPGLRVAMLFPPGNAAHRSPLA